jgi:hypothetical protein
MPNQFRGLQRRIFCLTIASLSVLALQGCTAEPKPTEENIEVPPAESRPATMATPQTAVPSPMPSASPSPGEGTIIAPSPTPKPIASPVAALQEQYTMKSRFSASLPATFDVSVNGVQAASFTTNSEQDLTPLLRPGKNTITIRSIPQNMGRSVSKFLDSTLTIGVNRGGAWSTVITQTVKGDSKEQTKTYTIMAK